MILNCRECSAAEGKLKVHIKSTMSHDQISQLHSKLRNMLPVDGVPDDEDCIFWLIIGKRRQLVSIVLYSVDIAYK